MFQKLIEGVIGMASNFVSVALLLATTAISGIDKSKTWKNGLHDNDRAQLGNVFHG
jgi:hypothetical protein